MDSIATARDFFINQQGMSPDQADMIVSQGLQAYNQQTQPRSMMQMASGGIARLGYQMGGSPIGVQTMPMDYGASLQIPSQQQPMFTSTGNATSSPLLNYGQTNIGKAGGTPLTMRSGGIARLGYQEGGMTMTQFGTPQEEPIFPRLETLSENLGQAEEKLGTPSNNQFGISPMTSAFTGQSRLGYQTGGVTLPSQGSEMSQMQGMDQQQALQTIIQILIENGIPPEQAQQLALQIIQIFAQGGAPAVEAFADQLEQEEVQAMASGGIAGYAYRQGYGFGGIGKIFSGAAKAVSGVVKGVAKAVKSVAKSPIGRAALTIAAATFLGPGAFGIQGLGLTGAGLGFATAGANLGLQALGGQKLNLLEAGLSGFSAGLSNPTVPASSAANITVPGAEVANAYNTVGVGNPNIIPADAGSYAGSVQKLYDPGMISSTAQDIAANQAASNIATSQGQTLQQLGQLKQPGFLESTYDTVKSGITNLAQDPMGTIKNLASSAYDYAKENPITTAIGVSSLATLGSQLGIPRNEGEDDESYAKRLAETQGYLTQYGRNLQIRNPYFYQREGAVNPFAPTMAANGGIMGYAKGGSMVPPARQIEGGIIELDARKTGGYIPYGKKERVDDVPAMLAKDEFVFTSRAVKAAGGGSARRGAAKMYALMKQLESKGARA
jgi:hypothetical protein